MVTGIVIPHEFGLGIFAQEFDDLASYQAAVGGYIEPVQIERPRMTLFANEEGKVRQLPTNHRATCLWWVQSPEARCRDILVGDIALVGSRGGAGSTTDLPRDFLDLLLATRRYRVESQTTSRPRSWVTHDIEFETYFDACIYGINLMERWSRVRDIRVVSAS